MELAFPRKIQPYVHLKNADYKIFIFEKKTQEKLFFSQTNLKDN